MHVRVGVASIIIRNDKSILLGMRKGSHGNKTWAPPGGHLEFNENPIDCAIRETKEEAGIAITNVSVGPWTNDIFAEEKKHYITLFMISNFKAGVPQILEQTKCEKWDWFTWEELPIPLFNPLINLIKLGHNIDTLQLYLQHKIR